MWKQTDAGDEVLSGMRKEGRALKKETTAVLAGGILILYAGTVVHLFLSVLQGDTLTNFASAMVFEFISFLALVCVIIGNILSKRVKTGYFVPLVLVTVVYAVILDVVNAAYITLMSQAGFLFLNLIMLFLYCCMSLPMYVMGKR